MKELKGGAYYGEQKTVQRYKNLIITETDYLHDFVDWHYHENAYFTYLLKGQLSETNQKESYQLIPGSLLFHQWQDPHYNVKAPGEARGFHIEMNTHWFAENHINPDSFQGSFQLNQPYLRKLIHQIYLETKEQDEFSPLCIQGLLLQTFGTFQRLETIATSRKPEWMSHVLELLRDEKTGKHSLESIAKQVNVHPVHLSREFPKHVGCTLGNYLRHLKIEKSVALLHQRSLSIMAIAHECGFSDESHFIRSFKAARGITPARYRNQVLPAKRILPC